MKSKFQKEVTMFYTTSLLYIHFGGQVKAYLPGAGVALIKEDAPPGRGLPLHSGLLNLAISSNVGNSGV